MVTLDWGNSFVTGDPVFPTVVAAAGRTAMYVLPALALAVVVGNVVQDLSYGVLDPRIDTSE